MSELHPLAVKLVKHPLIQGYLTEQISEWLNDRVNEFESQDNKLLRYPPKVKRSLREVLGIEKPKEPSLEEKLAVATVMNKDSNESLSFVLAKVAREHFAEGGK